MFRHHLDNTSRRSRLITAATAAALFTTGCLTLTSIPAKADAAPARPGAAPLFSTGAASGPGSSTVTLVTGDRVAFTGRGTKVQVTGVTPAPDRERIGFTRYHMNGHEYVMPTDAEELVNRGTVDEALFDVTGLVALGGDDKHSSTIPILAAGPGGGRDGMGGTTLRSAPAGTKVTRSLPRLGITALSVDKDRAATAWNRLTGSGTGKARTARAAARRLWLNSKVKTTLDVSVPQIGAPEAWKSGLTGKGVKVAVLDTGYDTGHPDLAGRVTGSKNFTSATSIQDRNGHGTHVSSTIAGSGAASGGRLKGVAPDVSLIEGKVLDDSGSGYTDWILAGMDWAVAQGADVVSMSLGSNAKTDGTDVLSAAVNRLSAESDSLFVVAAGNSGAAYTVGAPGAADSALTVGSVTKQDAVSSFSSRGPRFGDDAIKPEIAAPGTGIVAARAAGTLAAESVNSSYAKLSGTSMATPHVAGAAAIVKQAHPEWTGEQLKAALVAASDGVDQAGVFDVGAGRVDIPAALNGQVSAEPAVLQTVKAAQPVASTSPTVRRVTYTNRSDHAIQLNVREEATGPDGSTAPTALAVLDKNHVDIPAHGTGTVTLTLAPAAAVKSGAYSGIVSASGSGQSIRIPFALTVEHTTHNLTLTGADNRPGVDNSTTSALVQNTSTGNSVRISLAPGKTKRLALPAGDYRVFGLVWEQHLNGTTEVATAAVHYAYQVSLDSDRTVTVDIADAKPVALGVDRDDAVSTTYAGTGLVSTVGGSSGSATTGLIAPLNANAHSVYAVASTGPEMPGFSFFGAGSFQQPWVTARDTSTSKPIDVQINPYYFAGWFGDVSGAVVDVANGADISGQDLKGKVVLFEPGFIDPTAVRTARYNAIKAAGAAAIVVSGYISGSQPTDPILSIDVANTKRLRALLATGPLALRLTGTTGSAYHYLTFHQVDGRVPAGARWTDRTSDLAKVRTTAWAPGYPNDIKGLYGWIEHNGLVWLQQHTATRSPIATDLYLTPDVPWSTATFHILDSEGATVGAQYTEPTEYQVGKSYSNEWLKAPFNPSLSVRDSKGEPQVARTGDDLSIELPMFSDAAGHRSDNMSGMDSGSTVLTRDDGTPVADNDAPGKGEFRLSTDDGWYRLKIAAHRDGGPELGSHWPMSDSVTDEWRFRSGHTDTGRPKAASLLDLRYDLPLGGLEEIEIGKPATFHVAVARQTGSTGAPVTKVGMDYSVDGGATWTAASVRADGDRWAVEIPALAQGRVALRTHAVAADGSEVTETVRKAFEVGCVEFWCGHVG
ncbi:S8 family serine peptidase [Streptomyces sp. NPDC056653]|uniref:S8 family serine peptidase n=1 Tax=Streptomyces sp. NPDC056653 TaxID=3345894 RepID=UPI0036A3BDAB